MAFPDSARYVIIGAGIHGLSTAWHLAQALEARGKGSGKDILVIDKGGIAAGASGIACGVVRNNYFQPAMRELMAHSVAPGPGAKRSRGRGCRRRRSRSGQNRERPWDSSGGQRSAETKARRRPWAENRQDRSACIGKADTR